MYADELPFSLPTTVRTAWVPETAAVRGCLRHQPLKFAGACATRVPRPCRRPLDPYVQRPLHALYSTCLTSYMGPSWPMAWRLTGHGFLIIIYISYNTKGCGPSRAITYYVLGTHRVCPNNCFAGASRHAALHLHNIYEGRSHCVTLAYTYSSSRLRTLRLVLSACILSHSCMTNYTVYVVFCTAGVL